MKNKLCRATGLAIAIGLSLVAPAQAQMAVFDPSNFVQNTLTATRTLSQIENQVRQLQNEAQMLINQARNLQELDFDSVNRLRETLARTEQLLDQAKGLAFEVSHAQDQFARLYPDQYGDAVSSGQLQSDALERWGSSLEALRTAVQMQAQTMENAQADESVLTDLVGASQSAVGALQAAQATNQLLALQSRQLIQTQQLQAAQGRATALEQARGVAAEERAREQRRRFMTGDANYSVEALHLFEE